MHLQKGFLLVGWFHLHLIDASVAEDPDSTPEVAVSAATAVESILLVPERRFSSGTVARIARSSGSEMVTSSSVRLTSAASA